MSDIDSEIDSTAVRSADRPASRRSLCFLFVRVGPVGGQDEAGVVPGSGGGVGAVAGSFPPSHRLSFFYGAFLRVFFPLLFLRCDRCLESKIPAYCRNSAG